MLSSIAEMQNLIEHRSAGRERQGSAIETRFATVGFRIDNSPEFGFFPRLKERASQYAGTLSGGEQQMLAMARDHLVAQAAAAR
jgi:ABC-type branched-subunit amino acid transport system ATPase component